MESKQIYEKSYENLRKIKKDLSANNEVKIKLDDLDAETRGIIKDALNSILLKRMSTLTTIISKVD